MFIFERLKKKKKKRIIIGNRLLWNFNVSSLTYTHTHKNPFLKTINLFKCNEVYINNIVTKVPNQESTATCLVQCILMLLNDCSFLQKKTDRPQQKLNGQFFTTAWWERIYTGRIPCGGISHHTFQEVCYKHCTFVREGTSTTKPFSFFTPAKFPTVVQEKDLTLKLNGKQSIVIELMKLLNYSLKSQTMLTLLIVVQASFHHLLCALNGGSCFIVSSLSNHVKSIPIIKLKVNEGKHCKNSCEIKETLMHNISNSPHLTGLSILKKTQCQQLSVKRNKYFKVFVFFDLYINSLYKFFFYIFTVIFEGV